MSLMRIDKLFSFEKGILQSSKCIPGKFNFITASSDWKTHTEYTHDCEALIFAAAASGSLGRTHYVNGKFVSSDLCFVITPKDNENFPVDLKFYHILFNELKDEIVRNTKAGTSKEAIGLGSFGQYELPYFEIEKQIEIKNQFVYSEELKSNLTIELTHQLTLVKKLRQQFLQDAVQGKLLTHNPSQKESGESASELLKKIKSEKAKLLAEKKLKKEKELPPIKPEEIPFEIPEAWVWCRLGEVFHIVRGSSPRPKGDPQYWSKEKTPYHWITIADFTPFETNGILTNTKGFLTEAGSKKSREVSVGDLLIACSGVGSVGRSIRSGINGFIYDGLIAIRFIQHETIRTMVQHFLKYKEDQIYSVASGANWLNINIDIISNYVIALPPLFEQQLIVEKLNELMKYCDGLEASIKESQVQNEKLLQQVLREALRG